VQTTDEKTGRPVPEPVEFYIDIDICMNCGFCAEYCPFDAIKMDHNYELASYDRSEAHIFDKERLMRPAEYYAEIRPRNHAAEEAIRAEKAAKKAAAEKAKAERAARKAAEK
jgi:NADH-quinone oxidoreductase subunit I